MSPLASSGAFSSNDTVFRRYALSALHFEISSSVRLFITRGEGAAARRYLLSAADPCLPRYFKRSLDSPGWLLQQPEDAHNILYALLVVFTAPVPGAPGYSTPQDTAQLHCPQEELAPLITKFSVPLRVLIREVLPGGHRWAGPVAKADLADPDGPGTKLGAATLIRHCI